MRIGIGALSASTCGTFVNWLCTEGNFTGPTCQACAPKAPALAPGSVSPGLPEGYDPNTGAVDPGNVGGATLSNPYAPIYPNLNANDEYDSSGCDLSLQQWTDPSTWCGSRWIETLAFGALGIVLFTVFLGGRR